MRSAKIIKQGILLAGSIALIALLRWQLELKTPSGLEPEDEAASEYMTGIKLRQYNLSGSLSHYLMAGSWTYHQNAKLSNFQSPVLEVMKDNLIWTLAASRGFAQHNALNELPSLIHLEDQVQVKLPAQGHKAEISLTTQSLSYYPATQLIESKDWVTLTKPGLIITGQGMRTHLAKGQVELLNHVKTDYLLDPFK